MVDQLDQVGPVDLVDHDVPVYLVVPVFQVVQVVQVDQADQVDQLREVELVDLVVPVVQVDQVVQVVQVVQVEMDLVDWYSRLRAWLQCTHNDRSLLATAEVADRGDISIHATPTVATPTSRVQPT